MSSRAVQANDERQKLEAAEAGKRQREGLKIRASITPKRKNSNEKIEVVNNGDKEADDTAVVADAAVAVVDVVEAPVVTE